MGETTNAGFLFEEIVRRLFESQGMSAMPLLPDDSWGADLAGDAAGITWAAATKYYRSARVRPSFLMTAAGQAAGAAMLLKKDEAILVVSCEVSKALRDEIFGQYGVTVVDRHDLLSLAISDVEATEALLSIIEIDLEDLSRVTPDYRIEFARRLPSTKPSAGTPPDHLPEVDTEGDKLAAALDDLPPGKQSAGAYEKLCEAILRYLFPVDLDGWHRQQRTDDDLNRFDLVCRIKPNQEFWKFLADHLNSRYVLFEFKNYRDKISQGQILTTEKYLLERGLRRVALVITRAGPSEGATRMMQGAMREHGKLILTIDDNLVKQMLKMRQGGEDPSDRLFDLADQFLLTLPR